MILNNKECENVSFVFTGIFSSSVLNEIRSSESLGKVGEHLFVFLVSPS